MNTRPRRAVYTGLAIANDGNQDLLYVANFPSGQVEVYNGHFQPVSKSNDPDWTLPTNPFRRPQPARRLRPLQRPEHRRRHRTSTFAKQGARPTSATAELGDWLRGRLHARRGPWSSG